MPIGRPVFGLCAGRNFITLMEELNEMKMTRQRVFGSLTGAIVCLAMVAGAQTPSESTPNPSTSTAPPPAAAPAPVWSAGSIDFSGFVDGYFSYNFNRPATQTNQLYDFD